MWEKEGKGEKEEEEEEAGVRRGVKVTGCANRCACRSPTLRELR